MDNILGSIALIVIILVGFITGPVYSSFSSQDTYINNYVKVVGNDFQKQVRNNGYIDASTYNAFLDKLNRTKRIYKVELVYTNKLIYPSGMDDSKAFYIDHGNEEIFNTIFDNNKKYYMNYGDDFNVVITETKVENSTMLLSSLYVFNGQSNKLLSFNYGGMVENGSE